MKNTKLLRVLSLILCLVLITATALTLGSCGKQEETPATSAVETTAADATAADTTAADAAGADATDIGEGKHEFTFTVKYDDTEKNFTVHTDKETVGEALLELKLVEGDDSEYGLYVKVVDGVTADYDVDQTYWAFYVNGEYAMTGVDQTAVTDGATYTFAKEK